MKKTIVIAVLMVVMILIVGTVGATPTNFRAHLTAEAPNSDSLGQGQANFKLNGNELSYILAVSKLQGDTTAAHIHVSTEPGGNGGIFVSLCGQFGPQPIPVDDCGGPGNPAKGTHTLSDDQVDALMMAISENRAYVNVHTTVHPSGEIRGQIWTRP